MESDILLFFKEEYECDDAELCTLNINADIEMKRRYLNDILKILFMIWIKTDD